jgi:iron complex transport system ATP-binding protein
METMKEMPLEHQIGVNMKEFRIDRIDVAYEEQNIIEQLSLEIPMGKITTIIGPNGCGKSTLLKAMGRIMKVRKGKVSLDGESIYELSTRELAKQMAILPQSPTAPDGLTVEELVSYGRYPYQKGLGKLNTEDRRVIDWALEVTGLAQLRESTVDNLSGGQRQRVWIAVALAQETDIILLDEPTTYLDMAYQLEVLELLRDLNLEHGCTIVMVLHDLNLASRYSDFLIAMKKGKVICSGTPAQVICREILKEVYEIDADIITDSRSEKPICVSYELLNKKSKHSDKVKKVAS